MKAFFKKALSVIAATAITATCMSAATLPVMFASADEITGNIAPQGTAFDNYIEGEDVSYLMDGENIYWTGTEEYLNLNDGNDSTTWQFAKSGSNGDYNIYCGVKYNVAVTATSFSILTNAGESGDGNNDALASGKWTVAYNDGTQWVDVEGVLTDKTIEYTFAEATEIYGVRLYVTRHNKYMPKIKEIYIYGTTTTEAMAKHRLINAVAEVNALTSTDYTAETWAAVETALTNAEAALANEDAVEDDFTTCTTALTDAVAVLEFDAVDKLNKALAEAAALVEYKYTPETWATLETRVTEAEAYSSVTSPDETQAAAMMTCVENINSAIVALEVDNLSIGETAFVDSFNDDARPASNINNGVMSDRWQSNNNCSETPAYAGIQYATATTVDTIDIYWEINYPSLSAEKIQYSSDGNYWLDVTDATLSSISETADGSGVYSQHITFSAIKVKYLRVYITGPNNGAKNNMSIYEFETYNSTKTELEEETTAWAINGLGAQKRDSVTVDGANDMRFVTAVDITFWTENADSVTAIGTLMARADQLEAAGLDGTVLTLDFANDDVVVKDVYAVYLNNTSASEGYYEFYSTITGITSDYYDREYVAVSYCTVGDITYYTSPVTRCINDGTAA